MIRVKNLVRRFGSFTAVDDISFVLEKGEVVGFLGPNGAGKTTTMRMLTGFLPATRGSIEVAGFDVLSQSIEVRRRIGYLPEGVPLYREHRVGEMLTFQGRLHGLSARDIRRRADEVLERVGMSEKKRSLVRTLSKGQRQRIGLAVALLPDPEVLILDEPTSGLDPLQRIEVRRLIRELAEKRTVLLSSHILPEVEAVCPRVIVLHQGRIAAAGTPAELEQSMADEAYVTLEAVVPESGEAARLLGTLPGVVDVQVVGRQGIHTGFKIQGAGDLREDVGALAAARGWALRELSWHRPTLEHLFMRLSLELDPGEALTRRKSTPDEPESLDESLPMLEVEFSSSGAASAKTGAPPSAPVVLNPFHTGEPGAPPLPDEKPGEHCP